jgi:hypothetical protein
MRHEEAGAFAAAAEALLTGHLIACAATCGPGSPHFINGLYEGSDRNRAPVILIATQVMRQDLRFESIQEIDFEEVFKGCSVYCEMIVTPKQARRKTVAACQAAPDESAVSRCSSCQFFEHLGLVGFLLVAWLDVRPTGATLRANEAARALPWFLRAAERRSLRAKVRRWRPSATQPSPCSGSQPSFPMSACGCRTLLPAGS